MSQGKLDPKYFFDIEYDWLTYSIFFLNPIEINFKEFNYQKILGHGLGGFSKSFFERSTDCSLCGNCCYGKQQVWQWLPNENHPEDVSPYEYSINDTSIEVNLHVNQKNTLKEGCDYLQPLEEIHPITKKPKYGCSLHLQDKKPIHCSQLPQILSYKVNLKNFKDIHLLSKRLPGRNWRTPQCPIDVYSLKRNNEEIEKDRKLLTTWVKGFGYLPNCKIEILYEMWEKIIEKMKNDYILMDNVIFSLYLNEKELYLDKILKPKELENTLFFK